MAHAMLLAVVYLAFISLVLRHLGTGAVLTMVWCLDRVT
jgi:hypothetical protein